MITELLIFNIKKLEEKDRREWRERERERERHTQVHEISFRQ